MTLEHKYYSFDEMPEGQAFAALGYDRIYIKIDNELCFIPNYGTPEEGQPKTYFGAKKLKTMQFIPLPPKPKIYEKYLDGRWKLVLKAENGYPVLQVIFVQTAFGYKETIKAAIPAINAFLDDICGEGL